MPEDEILLPPSTEAEQEEVAALPQETSASGSKEPHPTPAVNPSDLPAEPPFSPGQVSRALDPNASPFVSVSASAASPFASFGAASSTSTTDNTSSLTASAPSAFGKAKSAAAGFGSFSSFSSPFARAKSPLGAPAGGSGSSGVPPSSPFASVATKQKDEGFSSLLKKAEEEKSKGDGKAVFKEQEGASWSL
jgi:hypothetical protein